MKEDENMKEEEKMSTYLLFINSLGFKRQTDRQTENNTILTDSLTGIHW